MHIYKTTNKITGKFYIGKEVGYKTYYLGSGKLLLQAIEKHGKENFIKETLEHCNSVEQLNEREIYWIDKLNALGNQGYNMAAGGSGGDLSKFIPYDKIDYSNHKMEGARKWWNSLTKEEQQAEQDRRHHSTCKGWYVSRVDNPTETYVHSISKWCEEHGIDKSMPTTLNNPKSHLFQKQTKGWRIRRTDMPKLPPYEDRRRMSTDNRCKGKTWKLVDGKRVWYDKYNIVEEQ
jgi:group I intron endonuclease